MAEQLISPIEGDGMKVREFRAPPRKLHSFGTAQPRAMTIEPVTAEAFYDPKIAYLTSVVAGWAYSDGETMAYQLPYYGLPDCIVREFKVVNRAMLVVAAAYFVRSADGRIGVLAFRGTVPDDFINWLTDANTLLRNFHFGQVHTGFYHNLEPLWGEIAGAIEDSLIAKDGNGRPGMRPLENLYITGHSLGAAMAVIAAARIFTNEYQRLQPLVRGVYTFGQPAAGDRDFGEHYGARFKLYRHVYRGDVVPHLPPMTFGKFAHFGQEFYAASSGWQNASPPRVKPIAFATLAAASALFDFVSRRIVVLRRFELPYSMDDHGPEGYIHTSRLSLG